MMLPAFAGMAALDYMKQQEAAKAAKQQAASNIMQQSAGRLGAPSTAMAQAVQVQHQNRPGTLTGHMASSALENYLQTSGTPTAAAPQEPRSADPEFDSMMQQGNELTGFEDEDEALGSIGVY